MLPRDNTAPLPTVTPGPTIERAASHCACRKSDWCVTMMQPTDHGVGDDPAQQLYRAADRCVLSQGQMRAGLVVVAGASGHDPAQVCLA
jgi:hypothetical protein